MTRTIEQGFLQDISEHPDDDAPRLIYADWLEEGAECQNDDDPRYARGQFIRAQIDAARAATIDEKAAADRRACKLLTRHEWSQPFYDIGCDAVTFARGFPDAIALSGDELQKHGEEIFALAPTTRSLYVTNATDEVAKTLGEASWVPDLSDLALRPPLLHEGVTPKGVRSIVSSPKLERLTRLDLMGNSLGDEGVRTLAQSPNLTGLTHLCLERNWLGPGAALAIAESPHLRNLSSLYLSHNDITPEVARELATSPNLPHLTHLDLHRTNVGAHLRREINDGLSRRSRQLGQEPGGVGMAG